MGIVHNTPLQTHEGNHKIVTMIFTDSNKTLLVFPLNTPVYILSFYFFYSTPVPLLTSTTKKCHVPLSVL